LEKITTGELSAEHALRLLVQVPQLPVDAPVLPGAELPLFEASVMDKKKRTAALLESLEAKIGSIIAAEAGVPASRVAPQMPFERYGFDSVMALNVVRVLQRSFGDLSPTLLFEHQTVASLAAYLVQEHEEEALQLVGHEPAKVAEAPVKPLFDTPIQQDQGSPNQSTSRTTPVETEDKIAIVGLSCRLPMAENLDEFWQNLKQARDCVTEVPDDRWDYRLNFDPEKGKAGKSYSKWGAFLENVDCFDAGFFHISPREAERMDPQERLLLEEVWHALEDAALTRRRLADRTVGVYIGVMYSQYQLLEAEEAVKGNFLYLGSSYASIANRISYFFNFQGPSIALDTMCSSSLTALHLACEALRSGAVQVAVAGGVNLTIHPNKYLDLSQGRFASSDGRCRSFGAGGDGYVPGEGVGVAILKPLSTAQADGDRILAVIRGSSLNHGGKTNGYSVPNPKAQTALVSQAMRQAGVNPRHISYVEAHGTGTSLGDPIEIASLAAAFGQDNSERQFCAIGSVKSNIGHLEAAAGIAGVAKVVLQMRNKQLVPSLHAKSLNPHINFADTPFRVQQTPEPWRPQVIPGNEAGLRIAGISSFGAGGANAHLILEEYIEQEHEQDEKRNNERHLMLLSARNEERLKILASVVAERLMNIDLAGKTENDVLADIAYILQTGREPQDERMAFWVDSIAELNQKLLGFAKGEKNSDVLHGRVGELRNELGFILSGAAGDFFIKQLAGAQDRARLARLWLQGNDIDWEKLTPVRRSRKLALPGYPFARERHWPVLTLQEQRSAKPNMEPLHPLVGCNISTLRQQVFKTCFDGNEFFLMDHVVGGNRILPAAASLEMMRAAAACSGLGEFCSIENTTWEKPFSITEQSHRELFIGLVPRGTKVDCTIWSGSEADGRDVHAHGTLVARTEPRGHNQEKIDPNLLMAACSESVTRANCYQIFAAHGLRYGPSFQTLDVVHTNGTQALGKLTLMATDGATSAFVLHPALLDGAFQTIVGLPRELAADATEVPYSVECVDVWSPLPAACYVHTVARTSAVADSSSRIFDITICDQEGTIIARILGLTLRLSGGRQPSLPTLSSETVVLRPVWKKAPATGEEAQIAGRIRRLLVFEKCQPEERSLSVAIAQKQPGTEVTTVYPGERFQERGDGNYEVGPRNASDYLQLIERVCSKKGGAPDAIIHAWSHVSDQSLVTAEMLDLGFFSLLALTQALMQKKSKGSTRLLYVHPSSGKRPSPPFTAIGAFNKTVARENPSFTFTSLEVAAAPDGSWSWEEDPAEQMLEELATKTVAGTQVRYEQGSRLVRHLEIFPDWSAQGFGLLRKNGVYLLTGGCGGLGKAFAEFLAERFQARLILSGRTPIDSGHQTWIEHLRSLGGDAVYIEADCSRREDANRVVGDAKRCFGQINGVLHLAGTLRDGLLLRKRPEDAEAVLAPKVWGTRYLDEAAGDEPLDFFALFSSATACMGTVGQCDYAFANAFMDDFADWREEARRNQVRSGKTISINWPLWQEGGMGVDDTARKYIEQRFGWVPLPKEEGFRIFSTALTGDDAGWAVFHGRKEQILASLEVTPAAVEPKPGKFVQPTDAPAASKTAGKNIQQSALIAYLTKIVATELKMDTGNLDPATPFEYLGIESVMVMNITREIEKDFGEISKSLFFEYKTVVELANYFVDHHNARVAAMLPKAGTLERPERTHPLQAKTSDSVAPAIRFLSASTGTAPSDQGPEKIAIIGLAGRYPMAETLDDFWSNLCAGRDCVTEVPDQRWNHSKYFDSTKNRQGKSYSKWGGFLHDFDRFDPLFFRISPHEARLMDPQERLFLQTAWQTLEDAGYSPKGLSNSQVGVFVGVMYSQYQLYGADESMQARGFIPGALSASVANRVSYVLDLKGPSLAIDTMCSSSLTALHLACSSIRNGDCGLAIAGGVNLTVHPNKYLMLSQGKFASTDGKCRSFGEGGDGYVPGEGVGAVLLKPLTQALKDGDHIYAVILGSAVNHGGHANGYSVPTPVAQGEVILRAMQRAGVSPADIGYVEAHGTGTSLGDPIEISGLVRAFQAVGNVVPNQRCAIGSVKSNIGHLESAAGVAALTKVLLQMKHGWLVPSIHSQPLNASINFQEGCFTVQRTLEPWLRRKVAGEIRPRISAISSFGAGGSNAHVIVAEHVMPAVEGEQDSGPQLVVLSAKTEAQLRRYANGLANFLDKTERREGGLSTTASDEDLLAKLVIVAADSMNVQVEEIVVDEPLEDLGFDTLALTRLTEWISNDYGSPIGAENLSGSDSLRAVSQRMARPAAQLPAPILLRNIAFTLQIGREAFDERLAIIASNCSDLVGKLRRFCAGEGDADEIIYGRVTAGNTALKTLLGGEEGAAYLRAVYAGANHAKMARLWVSGVDFNWTLLHTEHQVQRISLPTYPFDRDRYWVPTEIGETQTAQVAALVETASRTQQPQIAVPIHQLDDSELTPLEPIANHPPEEPSASELQSQRKIAQTAIIAAMASVLEIGESEFDLELPHSEFGVDSVLAVEIIDRINGTLGTELQPTDFFNYATIAKLADYIAKNGAKIALRARWASIVHPIKDVTKHPRSTLQSFTGQRPEICTDARHSDDAVSVSRNSEIPLDPHIAYEDLVDLVLRRLECGEIKAGEAERHLQRARDISSQILANGAMEPVQVIERSPLAREGELANEIERRLKTGVTFVEEAEDDLTVVMAQNLGKDLWN
jgi:acyl transferase domain-containing protein